MKKIKIAMSLCGLGIVTAGVSAAVSLTSCQNNDDKYSIEGNFNITGNINSPGQTTYNLKDNTSGVIITGGEHWYIKNQPLNVQIDEYSGVLSWNENRGGAYNFEIFVKVSDKDVAQHAVTLTINNSPVIGGIAAWDNIKDFFLIDGGNNELISVKSNEVDNFKQYLDSNKCNGIEIKNDVTNAAFTIADTAFTNIFGDWLFAENSKIQYLKLTVSGDTQSTIQNKITINQEAFRDCVALKEIQLHYLNTTNQSEGTLEIGDNVFNGCKNLDGFSFSNASDTTPFQITAVGTNAFANCNDLDINHFYPNVNKPVEFSITNVTPAGNGDGGLALIKDGTPLNALVGNFIIGDWSTNTQLIFGSGGKGLIGDDHNITQGLFQNCGSLTKILFQRYDDFQTTPWSIAADAFTNCSSLVEIHLWSNTPGVKIGTVDSHAFDNVNSKGTIYCQDDTQRTEAQKLIDGATGLKNWSIAIG